MKRAKLKPELELIKENRENAPSSLIVLGNICALELEYRIKLEEEDTFAVFASLQNLSLKEQTICLRFSPFRLYPNSFFQGVLKKTYPPYIVLPQEITNQLLSGEKLEFPKVGYIIDPFSWKTGAQAEVIFCPPEPKSKRAA